MNDNTRSHADPASQLVSVPIADVFACASDLSARPCVQVKNAMICIGVAQKASQRVATASIRVEGPQAREEWAGLRIAIAVGASCTGVPLREVLSAAVDQMPSLEYAARFAGLEQSDLLPIEIHLYPSRSTKYPRCRCP